MFRNTMAENETRQVTEQELREAELQMSGRPPGVATGFIGFVPATPANSNGNLGAGGPAHDAQQTQKT
jgi:hypothetical protein